MAAVLALAVVALPWIIGPRGGTAPGGPGASGSGSNGAAESSAPTIESTVAAPTPTPVPLAHAAKWNITFDYPAAWKLVDEGPAPSDPNDPLIYDKVHEAMGFVGSGSATQKCTAWVQGSWATCATTWSLPDNSVVLRFGQASWIPVTGEDTYTWTVQQAVYGPEIPGAQRLTIDGMPVRFASNASDVVPHSSETVPGATEVLWWGVPSPMPSQFAFSIVAAIKGPNTAELEAQARAVVESIHFVPEPHMLPTDPTALADARSRALIQYFATSTQLSDGEHNHSLDCFPRTPGESQQASITQTLNTAPMTKPLPVTCTTVSIEPNEMQGWTIILKQTWAAGPDYPAGEMGVNSYTLDNGEPLGGSYLGSPKGSGIEYPHVGPSKYKG